MTTTTSPHVQKQSIWAATKKMPGYPALQQIVATLRGTMADPRVGYEHSPAYEVFGSMRIFESLPRLAHRATLEGVLLQTAVTSPFVYYIQSLVSAQGTSVIPGYSYPDSDPVRGTAAHQGRGHRLPDRAAGHRAPL